MKVGIPRALLFYTFFPMWTIFFKELGAKVIVSPNTTKQIKTEAIGLAPDEDCYSTKLYFGHVMAIKDKVDYLFIPRFGSSHKTNVGCPKFIGLAEVLKSMFPDLPPIIMPFYSTAKSGHGKRRLFYLIFSIGFKFTKNPFRIIKAARRAFKAQKVHYENLFLDEKTLHKWEQTEYLLNNSRSPEESERPLKIVLVGHSYMLNDDLASQFKKWVIQDYSWLKESKDSFDYDNFIEGLNWFINSTCPRCRNSTDSWCDVKKCEKIKKETIDNCLVCDEFANCQKTDYQRNRYSYLFNLVDFIRKEGLEKFLEEEERKAKEGIRIQEIRDY